MKHKTTAAMLSTLFVSALSAACGGSSGGGGGGVTGINGTGYVRGPVQRFGSVFVNGREFNTSGAV
ncbi:MAG: hypothetical protein L0H83_15770, partial [Salinisphaera sp.]|nr:hypothetical protein [Salinisphaera sp.]